MAPSVLINDENQKMNPHPKEKDHPPLQSLEYFEDYIYAEKVGIMSKVGVNYLPNTKIPKTTDRYDTIDRFSEIGK